MNGNLGVGRLAFILPDKPQLKIICYMVYFRNCSRTAFVSECDP